MEKYEKAIDSFATVATRLLGIEIGNIVEIGARDCAETLRFRELYPSSKIYAFECNPDTLPLCRCVVDTMSSVYLVEKAVTNIDGITNFYQIDREKTQTTWRDGNPGASSLLISSGKYPLENYVQKEINVQAITMNKFMRERDIAEIDLLWMDIQGGELKALEGFGCRIHDIKLIHTEVEFFEIYENQPLFNDVKQFLSKKGFFFVGFTTLGFYSADAIFINKRYLNKNYLAHLFKHFFSDKQAIWKMKLLNACKYKYCSRLTSYLNLKLSSIISKCSREWYLTKSIQVTTAYLWNLTRTQFSNIPLDILITAVEKDADVLPVVITSVRKNIKHPISEIYIVGPISEKLKKICSENDCTFVNEDEVLPFSKDDLNYMVNGVDRAGWLYQQFIKLNGDTICSTEHYLSLDADTILVQPQIFVSNDKCVLLYSDEYHQPYFDIYRRLFIENAKCPVSLVSHQMIFDRRKLNEMKVQLELLHSCKWHNAILDKLDYCEFSGFSEFETYGQYMFLHHKSDIILQYFSNKSLKREKMQNFEQIEMLYGDKYKSVSFHSWNR